MLGNVIKNQTWCPIINIGIEWQIRVLFEVSHNIITKYVYFMKKVKDCNDVSVIFLQYRQ